MSNDKKLIDLGFRPNIRHFGRVEWYNPTLNPGRGDIYTYLPYATGKKWRSVPVWSTAINRPNDYLGGRFTLAMNNLVSFTPGISEKGVIAFNVRVHANEILTEKLEKVINKWTSKLYMSVDNHIDIDKFLHHVLRQPGFESDEVLPKIKRPSKQGILV